MIRIALPLMLTALFVVAGCQKSGNVQAPKGTDAAANVDFSKQWPKDAVAQLTEEQRQYLLGQALVGIRGVEWLHSQEVLVSLGRDAVPSLIALVGSKDSTAAAAGPIPSASFKTLGEVANDTLVLIVQNRSSYRGEMPARTQDGWNKWLAANASTLAK